MQRSALYRSRRELSNAYFLAKFGFDTEENELCKVCPLSAYRSLLLLLQIPQVFDKFDRNGSGSLDFDEFRRILKYRDEVLVMLWRETIVLDFPQVRQNSIQISTKNDRVSEQNPS